jgi:hypothetical protein
VKKEFPELPGWSFEVEELPAGRYRIVGTEKGGKTFDMQGTDYDSLLKDCQEEAAALSEQTQFERR